ncbi:drug/metabolite transporter (DMT)-like permease [Rhizobium sp. BK650]|uniref:DMT family transporter n=1 Tax=Rhizobium sp. BK650 TaxID=2586990 RepID=UPI00160F4BE7|nr:DMT family transporter [Rhizobium sp. BK650]MBB3659724.1 drug/metabolite transporter (DMT)-like permease [Rhizobium sp. BK650]
MRRELLARLSILLAAGFFSSAGFFVGFLDMNVWAILFWRSLFALGLTSLFITMQPARFTLLHLDWPAILAAVSSAAATIAFIPSLRLTSVANVAVIHGALPLITVVLSGLIRDERICRRTISLCVLVAVGTIVIFAGSTTSGTRLAGDGLALMMTIFMAVMTIAFKRSHLMSVLPMVALSNAIAMMGGAIMAPSLALDGKQALIVSCFALFQISFGLILYARGARLLPPPETALLSLCEMPLSALWAWLAFDQRPTLQTILGGGIVLAAVIAHLTVPKGRIVPTEE